MSVKLFDFRALLELFVPAGFCRVSAKSCSKT